MTTIKGQCFDCYDNSLFQVKGQTGEFIPLQVKLDYVDMLEKPSTTVECESCGRTLEYTENDGYWATKIIEKPIDN